MNKALIMLGANGHAKVLLDTILLSPEKYNIIGLLERDGVEIVGHTIYGVKVVGTDSNIDRYASSDVDLVIGLGSIIPYPARRHSLYENFKKQGYQFPVIRHPGAIVSDYAHIAEGVQIMAGSIIQNDVTIGENVLVNTGARIAHGTEIGSHVHIAPGAILSGDISIGSGTHIGVGAVIIQGITIGKNCMIAAGAVVVKDVKDGEKVAGVPAKIM